MKMVLGESAFQKDLVSTATASRAWSMVELSNSTDKLFFCGGVYSGSHTTLMPASLPTVSKRTLTGWLFILRRMGSGLSGLGLGAGNKRGVLSRVSFLASSAGVRALSWAGASRPVSS